MKCFLARISLPWTPMASVVLADNHQTGVYAGLSSPSSPLTAVYIPPQQKPTKQIYKTDRPMVFLLMTTAVFGFCLEYITA